MHRALVQTRLRSGAGCVSLTVCMLFSLAHGWAQAIVIDDRALPSVVQFLQQGPKLVGSGASFANQGRSVSLSADGTTAIVGGTLDNNGTGAAWIWIRNGGVWTQQGLKLVGSGGVGTQQIQGSSVSLSADGITAIVGGIGDNSNVGAAWVWVRNAGVWTQQGPKLVGSDVVGSARQGTSVSLSADGNTAIVGGGSDNSSVGAAWVWIRTAGVWTQQGPKLVGSDVVGSAGQGLSVSLSADGNTAVVGSSAGTVVWIRNAGVWTQQGPKLVGSDGVGNAGSGWGVSLSADGNTAIVGGIADNSDTGAAWVWIRNGGVWTQQGPKLVGSSAVGSAQQGWSVSLSGDGNRAIVGGFADNSNVGAAWVWARGGGVWKQQGPKLVGSGAVGPSRQGMSVSLSADGNTAVVGGIGDNNTAGAAWVFAGSTPTFTDDPLTPGTVVKAVHITELRARIDSLRASHGLPAYGWTDPTITNGSTGILALHILELRGALAQAYDAAGGMPPAYTDPSLGAGTVIKAVHMTELRAAVVTLE
jgi:hypothetical protein